MSQIYTAPLDLEQFQDKEDTSELPIELDVWSYWYENGFPVDDILEAYCAVHKKVDDEDTSHVVLKVETLSKPIDEADVVADSVTRWCCDCGRFAYHENVDLSETSVMEWGHCHHIQQVDPSIKAKSDPDQSELVE